MDEKRLGRVEARFADIVWAHAPVPSGELVKLCERELSWKKSTTYTVLKKLCERGLFRNENGVVTAELTREDFYAARSEQFVAETFSGSLPAFIAAFTARKPLSQKEIEEIRRMIDAIAPEDA